MPFLDHVSMQQDHRRDILFGSLHSTYQPCCCVQHDSCTGTHCLTNITIDSFVQCAPFSQITAFCISMVSDLGAVSAFCLI